MVLLIQFLSLWDLVTPRFLNYQHPSYQHPSPTSQLPTSQSPQPSLSPQSGNVAQPRSVVDQTDSNPVDEKTVKSEGIAKIEATSPRIQSAPVQSAPLYNQRLVQSAPVPIVTPLDGSVTTLPPNVVGPDVPFTFNSTTRESRHSRSRLRGHLS